MFDHRHCVVAEEPRVLVCRVFLANGEGYGFRLAPWKVGRLLVQQNVPALLRLVELGVVLDDELPGAAYQEQTHEVAPIVGIGALLEGAKRMRGGLELGDELCLGLAVLRPVLKKALRADVQVLALVNEQP